MKHFLSAQARHSVVVIAIAWLATASLFVSPAPALGQDQTPIPTVDELIDALTGDDLLAAERAAQQLAAIGPAQAVPRLSEIFLTSDTPRLAAIALGGIGTQQAARTLAPALADQELTPRRNAAQIGLLYGGQEAINILQVTLRAPQAAARRHAAELLGYLASPFALNALLRAAHQDSDPSVRQAAVWALSQIDSPRVRPALVEISVRDPDATVRDEALNALLRLNEGFQ